MDMLNVKINGISVSVEKGSTILDAARAAGVEIPTLCFMKEKNEIGACRICVVEANEGRGFRIVTACVYPVSEGMEVLTNTEKFRKQEGLPWSLFSQPTRKSAFPAFVPQTASCKSSAAITA